MRNPMAFATRAPPASFASTIAMVLPMVGENATPPPYATMPPDRPAPYCVLLVAVDALAVTVSTGDTYATLPPTPVEERVAPPLVLAFSP